MFSHDDTIVTDSIFVAESRNFAFDRRGRIKRVGRFGFRNYLNPALLSGVTFKGFIGEFPEGGFLYALVGKNSIKRRNISSLYFVGAETSWWKIIVLRRKPSFFP